MHKNTYFIYNIQILTKKFLSVINTLERRYDVSIILTTSKYDANVITASFIHGETLDDLMGAICMIVPGMKYTREDNKIYIK